MTLLAATGIWMSLPAQRYSRAWASRCKGRWARRSVRAPVLLELGWLHARATVSAADGPERVSFSYSTASATCAA
eukprot:3862969-Pyramimonas_sp.AAC.1